MFKLKISVFLLITLLNICSFSQDISIAKFYEISSSNGITIPNIKPKKFYIDSRIQGFNFYIGNNNQDSSSWNKNFRFPDYGIGILINFFDESAIIGNQLTLYYRIHIPFNQVKRLGVYYTASIGPTLITNPFHYAENYLNKANGSLINVFAHFGINTRYFPTNKYAIRFGVNYYHISNGNIKLPNDGINIVAFETGISLNNYKKNRKLKSDNKFDFISKRALITLSFGTKQREILGENFFIYNISTEFLIRKTKRRGLGLGIDFNIDNSLKYNSTLAYFKEKNGVFYNGLYLNHSLILNKFIIVTNIGYYLDYLNIIEENVYYHLGFRYLIFDNLYTNFGLKARFSGGDYLGFGIGYAF